MTKAIAFLLFIITSICFGQNNAFLKDEGKSLQDIIPKDWKIIDYATGDLNQNGISDIVFAIQGTDSQKIEFNDGLGSDTIDLNPRIFGIYFGTKSGSYKQRYISNNFIILKDSPTLEEPFEGFGISDAGILEINYRICYNAGSWYMSNHKYKFRFQDNDFFLIGYDSSELHRASGETTEYSINFFTEKMKISKGHISKDVPDSIEWKDFRLKKLITIRTIDKPFELEFEVVYL